MTLPFNSEFKKIRNMSIFGKNLKFSIFLFGKLPGEMIFHDLTTFLFCLSGYAEREDKACKPVLGLLFNTNRC
jgi:hypothetical protein